MVVTYTLCEVVIPGCA